MSDLNSFLNSLPIDQLAQRVGASPEETRRALNDLLPSLLGGMQANAQTESGAASLSSALDQHVDGAKSVDDVDPEDGAKIAQHVFGDEQDAVVAKVADHSGSDKTLIQKLLPVVAPLVLAWLASRFTQKKEEEAQAQETPTQETPAQDTQTQTTQSQKAPQQESQSGGGILGDLLGDILGGGNKNGSSGGGIGDLLGQLGGLFGGGRK